jgi:hypothetical protein
MPKRFKTIVPFVSPASGYLAAFFAAATDSTALAGSGILAPGITRKTTLTVHSNKGGSNRPHAKRATRPPALSTRRISLKDVSMSAKNIIPKRQVIRSTLELEKGG